MGNKAGVETSPQLSHTASVIHSLPASRRMSILIAQHQMPFGLWNAAPHDTWNSESHGYELEHDARVKDIDKINQTFVEMLERI